MRRLLRRYLDLGARFAWLAERALAFEQERDIHLIQGDYYNPALEGIGGVDRLRLDVAELEASRLANVLETAPVKRTISLA